ncbi:MAG: 30S ribosomal protein S4 [Clostridia bacterium]|nr:30S ribosomal protein S4 [Clostridia bacterium]
MAKNTQPILKRCRTLGIEPSVMGISKTSKRNPKPMKRKQSEYGRQLTEKQKVKFIYGMLEKQFRKYYEIAIKMPGIAGENLLSLLESRLDNVVFRLGLANTRRESRQLVNHGHILVNGKRLDIPSYRVKIGDVITLKERTQGSERMKDIVEANSGRAVPKWLDMDKKTLTGKVIAMATREDIDFDVEEHLIVELYSK